MGARRSPQLTARLWAPANHLTAPKIAFIRTDRLGETLLTIPAVVALRRALPHSTITFLVHPAVAEVFDGHPALNGVVRVASDRTVPWWRQALHVARQLRPLRCDIAIVANPTKTLHAAVWLAGIPSRVGWNRKWGCLLTHRVVDDKALGERHEVEYNLDLIRALGMSVAPAPTPWLPVGDQAERRISQLFGQAGVPDSSQLLAVHPWTSNPRKQWPVDRFRALMQRLVQRADLTIVVIGARDEQVQTAGLVEACRGTGRVLNLAGRCSLRDLAALLKRVRVLVSNDSGPMHVAVAVGTPVVALFGTAEAGSHPTRWGPWGTTHTVIHHSLEAITVEEVVQAVGRYL